MSTRQKIIALENDLDRKEKVSLVFLVCDDPVRAMKILQNETSVLAAILDWAERSNGLKLEYMYERLKQAMFLLQNKVVWKELCSILKNKGKLQSWILPMRKALFEVCENMTVQELSILLNSIKKDFDLKCIADAELMELNLLFWLSEGYISDNDVTTVIHHLLNVNKSVEAEMLKTVMKNVRDEAMQTDNDLGHVSRADYSTHSAASTGDRYKMDIKNMGICLIVNQREFDPEAMKLQGVEFGVRRDGTDKDRDILKVLFLYFGYTVFVKENLNRFDLEREIQMVLNNHLMPQHSSFILCILSHGLEGAVYCVDAVTIKVKTIEKWISECKNLLEKPKIVIIQACQGKEPQIARARKNAEVDEGDTVETDGVHRCPRSPPRGDLLTFYATVPEHLSFRNTVAGSYFIRALASVMLKNGHKKHVLDLFTEVSREVSNCHIVRNGSTKCEVSMPMKTDSLRKELWFPYSHGAVAKSTMLYLENIIFELLFNEYCMRKVYNALKKQQSIL